MNKRIKLKEGVQRKLIETAKEKSKLDWKNLGKLIGVSGSYIKYELLNEYNLLSERAYTCLCALAQKKYESYILKRLDSNWGAIKGGKNPLCHVPKKPKLLVKSYSKELAEIIGIMLGDGNSWSKPGYYYVRVAGNIQNDHEYLVKYVSQLFRAVLSTEMQILYYPKVGEIFLQKGSKDLVFTLEKYGFPPGDKIKNKVKIPDWIFENKSYLKACIRGLIDTDGSVCPITNRNYPYIWFKSYNPALRNSFSKAMKLLGIRIAKWSSNESSQTYIGAKSHIGNYYKAIGFSNQYHRKRYERYAPVV